MKDWALVYNRDGQVFKNSNSEVRLDFSDGKIHMKGQSTQYSAPLARALQEQGTFLLMGSESVLWMLNPRVATVKDASSNQIPTLTDSSPVLIFFSKGAEKYRLTRKDLGFSSITENPEVTLMGVTGPIKTPASQTWLHRYKEAITPSGRTSHNRFVALLYLEAPADPNLKKMSTAVALEITSGKITRLAAFPGTPPPSPPEPPDDIKKSLEHSRKFLELQIWYKEENGKLAERLSGMTDKEVNAAAEKLLADYNRKLIKLTAETPLPNSSGTPSETTVPKQDPKQDQ